ncbi:energy-coupling factor ABC transporter ATP-binding protein [Paenibacillus cremeus]|uniref:ATP-binding cassette domain-containing protein n=1 Tax=Paenibacillus cremeus TaxID=2163881 RepID=A0A559KEM4_9BACL|nr:ATP-binding cassette domain-containing protein [Paenibacillus cremeus]TVY10574.1 ATP-binding cassette domain-containing protein [Paenibacillus cremeus]
MESMFQFHQVHYKYTKDRQAALNGVTFDIPRGKKTAIVGPNGAGKSTLIFHMNGLYLCHSGEVIINGEKVTSRNRQEWTRRIGVVFQDPDDQIISMTVKDDVAFGPLQQGLSPAAAHQKAADSMKLLSITELAELNPSELSFGQKKQVAIAGVVAMDTDTVILDEPMAFLDPLGQQRIQEIMDLLAASGKTVIIATHNMQLVAEWADHVVVMKHGACLGSMSPRDLFCSHPDLLAEAHLDLPPVMRLLSGLEWEDPSQQPIRIEEARAWLAGQLLWKNQETIRS